jgi:hypothetical protein
MPRAGFEPTIPVTKRSNPTPYTALPPGPADSSYADRKTQMMPTFPPDINTKYKTYLITKMTYHVLKGGQQSELQVRSN